MTYGPYLIANYATGIDRQLAPWLRPDDAMDPLYDGYVFRGVLNKRPGYIAFATGNRGGAPFTESRIVNNIPVEFASVTGNGTPGPYMFTLSEIPVARGTVTITAGAQSATDNGLGGFVTVPAGGTGTINYTTGAVSITFQNNVPGATAITTNYSYYPNDPVMGIMTFIADDNTKVLLVASTEFLNIYNVLTNRLEYLGHTSTITGITQANPGHVTTAAAHNLSTGDQVFISGVVGMTQVNNQSYTITVVDGTHFTIGVNTTGFGAYVSGGTVALMYTGSNSNFWSYVNYPDKNNNPRLIFTNNKDEVQYYAPSDAVPVGDYVNYPNAAAPDFMMKDGAGNPITTFTALQVFTMKNRLLFLRTTENGVVFPQRIRISGVGANCDNFLTTATGAGIIDIPDGTWIQGAAFNRDDLIIFTEASTWILKYTGNDVTPFVLNKIDESRGSQAAFAAITYLNRTTALSPRGMITSDGYRVERADFKLPDFSFNDVDPNVFDLCFAGIVDEDRDHYLIYPVPGQTSSSRILVTNYEEDNYSIYRIPLSCMGTFYITGTVTWADLFQYSNWAEFAQVYNNWNNFPVTKGTLIPLGGGPNGQVWRMNVSESEDNPLFVRAVSIIDATTLQITTDFNNYSLNNSDQSMGADYIYLTGLGGMIQANDKQYPISSVIDNYTFQVQVPSTAGFSAYTSGGTAARVIPFEADFKKFNPFANADKKVRCGWIYFYVSTTAPQLTNTYFISGATQTNPCIITTQVNHNMQTGDIVTIAGVSGMVQLNGGQYTITVTSSNTMFLNGIDATAFGAYTGGGIISTPQDAVISVDIVTNDTEQNVMDSDDQPHPFQANCTNIVVGTGRETGIKKWYKTYINQVGRFIQFKVRNQQAGANIQIHATMPGFSPQGRLI